MNFAELANITGKKPHTLQQAFWRRGLSIKKTKDVQTFIRQPRKKRRAVNTRHLAAYQFRNPAKRRGSSTVEQWIEHPRVVGSIPSPATNNMTLMKKVAQILLRHYSDIQGALFFGSRVMREDTATSDLDLLMVVNDRPGVMRQIEEAKLSVARIGEKLGCEIQVLHIDPESLSSSRLQIDPLLNFALRRGRVEFGFYTIPAMPDIPSKSVAVDAKEYLEDFRSVVSGKSPASWKISKKEALAFLKKFIALRYFLEGMDDINTHWHETFMSVKKATPAKIKNALKREYSLISKYVQG